MTNEEMHGCNMDVLLSAWKAYGRIVRRFLERRGSDISGSAAMSPVENPFEWLYKTCDTAIKPEFEPGRLVVDDEGRYGFVLERMVDTPINGKWRVGRVLVDFATTAGKVAINAEKLKPSEFPKEFLDFASSYKNCGLKDKIHNKIDEVFNEE